MARTYTELSTKSGTKTYVTVALPSHYQNPYRCFLSPHMRTRTGASAHTHSLFLSALKVLISNIHKYCSYAYSKASGKFEDKVKSVLFFSNRVSSSSVIMWN